MKILFNKKNIMLIIPLLIIMIISFLTMYNAKYISKIYTNHLNKQIIWYLLSFLILFFLPKYKLLFKYSFWLYLFNIILLGLVLFIGKEVNGAKAWFDFKLISFQPSELMKLTYTLYLTKIINNYKYKNIKCEFIFLIKIFFIFLFPSVLIFLEPDTGAIIFLFVITISMLLTSKIKKIWYVLILIILILLFSIFFYLYYFNQDLLINLIGTSFFYRMDRLINFSDTSNMQLENALITIGTSKMFGYGLKNVAIYIPEVATDFAFSLAIGSFGFIGAIVLILCYLLMNFYFINIIFKAKNKTTKLFTSGFVGVFIFSQIYNIFMNIGLLPIMGIPLPFLSYGGSSLVVFFLYIAIILRLNSNSI
jgi:rod shape determining protein RodA